MVNNNKTARANGGRFLSCPGRTVAHRSLLLVGILCVRSASLWWLLGAAGAAAAGAAAALVQLCKDVHRRLLQLATGLLELLRVRRRIINHFLEIRNFGVECVLLLSTDPLRMLTQAAREVLLTKKACQKKRRRVPFSHVISNALGGIFLLKQILLLHVFSTMRLYPSPVSCCGHPPDSGNITSASCFMRSISASLRPPDDCTRTS